MRIWFFLLLLPLGLLGYPVVGQAPPPPSGSVYVQQAANQALARYHKSLDGESRLYNGSEYVEHTRFSREHPFFASKDWDTSSVHYDGILFENIPLMFDIWRETVVIGHYDQDGYFTKMELLSPEVASFQVQGHTFVRLEADSTSPSQFTTGFYDQLFRGDDIQVLAKRQKKYQEYIENQQIKLTFPETTRYFIKKAGTYHPVKSKASAMRVFRDRKRELQLFIRENNLNYRTNQEETLVRMAAHYERLSK